MPSLETINLLQRITGLTAFGLMFIQIVLGSTKSFISFHKTNGILAYTFIFLHPILMILFKYVYGSGLDPFYVYTDFCVLCDGIYEYYINFGRLAFLSLTIAVFAGLFRGVNLWMRQNWRKMHILNYFAFYFVSLHSYNIGSDSLSPIFLSFFWLAQGVVGVIVIKKLKLLFKI